MPRFEYQAKNSENKTIKGFIEADDESNAAQELASQNLWVISLEEASAQSNLELEISLFNHISAETLSTFLLQLSILIKCGVNLAEALQSLQYGEESKAFKKVLEDLYVRVSEGLAFSDALAAHPKVFDRFTVAMIKVGETGGVLEQVLIKLSQSSKRQLALKGQIVGALAYPSILFLVAGLVLIVLMGFAVPRFAELFMSAGIALPIATQILLKLSSFISNNLVQVIIASVVTIIALIVMLLTPKGRILLGEISLKIPVFYKVTQRFFVVQIAESMALLLTAGVPLRELLLAIEGTMTMPTPKEVVRKMRDFIDQGRSLRESLENSPIFPPMSVKLIETGELTGSLDSMFGEVAQYYDDQLQAAIRSALSVLEPLLIAGMAMVVGFIMLAIFVPLFQMSFIKPK